jgi:hypothetical protein
MVGVFQEIRAAMTAVEDYAFRNMEGGSGHARPKIGTHAALKLFPGKLPDPKTGSAATGAMALVSRRGGERT